jgi:hypothetical protein
MPALLEVHRSMSFRMASHLQLTFDNILRWSWALAGTLSANPESARDGAREAIRSLFPTPPKSQLSVWFRENEELMRQLQMFADEEPPRLLWHCHGKYATLFKFVAARFCSTPDHVLDCEGIHSQWKWIEETRRNVKLKSLNAILKLASYVHFHGDLPPYHMLHPHIATLRAWLRQQYLAVIAGGQVAAGARAEWVYRERFNLQLADLELLRAPRLRQSGSSSPQVYHGSKMCTIERILLSFRLWARPKPLFCTKHMTLSGSNTRIRICVRSGNRRWLGRTICGHC